MNSGPISGPGVGLQVAQNLYPSELYNAPYDWSSNRIALAPGQVIPVPAGRWLFQCNYSFIQYLDPVSGTWAAGATAGWNGTIEEVWSDGFNVRLANMTATPIGAVVVNGGTLYVQATTTISPSVGNSSWSPIVGGALSLSTITNPGSGYGMPPLVPLPGPPPPGTNANGVGGRAATAYAVIANGTVSGVTFIDQGAGYNSLNQVTNTGTAGQIVLLPNPTDPNLSAGISNATIQISLTGSGVLTGVLCTNPGVALSNAQLATGLTLTVGGAGSAASLSALIPQVVSSLSSIVAVGSGYVNGTLLTTIGGTPAASALRTPESQNLAFRPRPAQIGLAVAGGTIASISTIYDAGMFLSAPTPLILSNSATTVSPVGASVTLAMGGITDFVIMQSAP